MEICKEEKRKVKRSIYQSKKNKQFGRKMNQDVDGNKLFWKEVSKAKS